MTPLEETDIAHELGELTAGQKATHTSLNGLHLKVDAQSSQVAVNTNDIAHIRKSLKEHRHSPSGGTVARKEPLTAKKVSTIVTGIILALGGLSALVTAIVKWKAATP